MNKAKANKLTRKYIESQFPRTCSNCGRTFQTLFDYLIKTRHLGDPIAYDEDALKVDGQNLTGVVSYANCVCGSTLTITSQAMDFLTYWRLMFWAKMESRKHKITISKLLRQVRKDIDDQVLSKYQ